MDDVLYARSPRTGFSRRHSTHPRGHQTRRSWTTDGGAHITLETDAYATPNISFVRQGGTFPDPFRDLLFPSASSRARRGRAVPQTGHSLFDTAFALFDTANALQRERPAPSRRASRRTAYVAEPEEGSEDGCEEDDDDDDADLAYGSPAPHAEGNQRSVFSRLKDKILDGVKERGRDLPHGQDPRAEHRVHDERRREPRRERSYRATSRGRSSRTIEESESSLSSEEESDDYEKFRRRSGAPSEKDHAAVLARLERIVAYEQRELLSSRQHLQQASQRQRVTSAHLQALLDEVKSHERDFARANRDLAQAKDARYRREQRQQSPRSTRPRNSRPSSARRVPDEDILYEHPLPGFRDGSAPFSTNAGVHPIFSLFEDFHSAGTFGGRDPFERLFHDLGVGQTFSTTGGGFTFHAAHRSSNKRPRFGANNGRPGHQGLPRDYSTYTATPQFTTQPARPPPNLLKIEEAKQLFKAYDARWNALSHADPDIPYPGRQLSASSLIARDSIWAPSVPSPVASWSDEHVMQANTRAFFLGVVDLGPTYADVGSKIEMGFNKAQASPEQVKALVDILKKEKMRWHSDRLGRRNGGRPGVNEALQRDDRARAVFHGVCELMDYAQSG